MTPRLLERLPESWCSDKLKKLLCSGVAIQLLLTSPAIAAKPKAAQSDNQKSSKDPANKIPGWLVDREKPFLQVAPILQAALENDGRGSFGCVCVSPPEFFSEEEALTLIRSKLAAAGVKLSKSKLKIGDVKCPEINQFGSFRREKIVLGFHKPRTYEFDGVSDDGRIVFDYISSGDYSKWQKKTGGWSSVYSINVADGAARFAESLAKTKSDKERTVGVFFDPMFQSSGNFWAWLKANNKVEEYNKLSNSSDWKAIQAMEEDYRKNYLPDELKRLGDSSKARLSKQVDEFLRYLRQQGVLPHSKKKD